MSNPDSTSDASVAPWRTKEFLLADRSWLDYVKGIYSIDPGTYPFLSYVGLNFTKDRIKNYKFYFSFFRRLSEEELQIVLPVQNRSHFDELYEQWQPSRVYDIIHRGTTFALKVDANGQLTHYYHLRVPGMPMGPPHRLTLSAEDENNLHGVCEEFTGNAVSLKRYYYCKDRNTVAESLSEVGLQDTVDQLPWIDCLEYIESETRDKMAWITASRRVIDTLVERRGSHRLTVALTKICYECGFMLFGPGSARDTGDHSLYFVQAHGPLSQGGYIFDGVQHFIAKYLGLNDLQK